MPTSHLAHATLFVALLGVLPGPARAQVEVVEMAEYDARRVALPSAPDKDSGPEGAILFGPRAVYLASIDPAGGAFGGAEFVLGGWVSLGGPLSLVVRARVGSYATVRSPALELDDTSCGGTWGFSLCFGDMDMLGLGVGGELGLRLQQRYATPDVGLGMVLGGELLASGTGYLDMFEHVREGGGLGAMLVLSAELVVRDRWGIGLEVGGRAEAGFLGSPDRLGAHAGLRFSFRP